MAQRHQADKDRGIQMKSECRIKLEHWIKGYKQIRCDEISNSDISVSDHSIPFFPSYWS